MNPPDTLHPVHTAASPARDLAEHETDTLRQPSTRPWMLGPWAERAACVSAGLLIAAPSYRSSLWMLPYLGLPLLFALVGAAADGRSALRRGFWSSLAANGLIFHFLLYTMETYGGLPRVASLCMFGLYLLVFCTRIPLLAWGTWHLHQRAGLRLGLAAGLAAVAAESYQLALFPLHLGSTQQQDLLLMQCADLVGISGVTLILAAVGGLLAEVGLESSGLVRQHIPAGSKRSLLVASLIVVVAHLYGWVRYQQIEGLAAAAPPIRVALIQPNTPLRFYRDDVSTARTILATCSRLTRAAASASSSPLDLVVWPEGGTPFSFDNQFDIYPTLFCPPPSASTPLSPPSPQLRSAQNTVRYIDRSFHQTVTSLARELHTHIAFNEAYYETSEAYNNMRLVDPAGHTVDSYQKMKLLAFGEYVPLDKTFPFMEGFGGVHDHRFGSHLHNLTTPRGPMAPQICYEILYPDGARQLVARGAQAILNLTNDAWFGPTHASPAHLLEAYPRAIEMRRPMVRATNSGTSTVIAASGRFVTPPSGVFEQAYQVAELRNPGVTSLYTAVGDWPIWLCTLWTLWLGLVRPRRRTV
jgi:apolipoprotein N-acyltransferase